MQTSIWLFPLLGGGLIGLASALLLLFNGRIAGISGIVSGAMMPLKNPQWAWRMVFVLGLIAGGAVLTFAFPQAFSGPLELPLPMAAGAGLLVGLGTRLGSGCTSGHGVCGIGRFSARSIVATITFISTGIITVWLLGIL